MYNMYIYMHIHHVECLKVLKEVGEMIKRHSLPLSFRPFQKASFINTFSLNSIIFCCKSPGGLGRSYFQWVFIWVSFETNCVISVPADPWLCLANQSHGADLHLSIGAGGKANILETITFLLLASFIWNMIKLCYIPPQKWTSCK